MSDAVWRVRGIASSNVGDEHRDWRWSEAFADGRAIAVREVSPPFAADGSTAVALETQPTQDTLPADAPTIDIVWPPKIAASAPPRRRSFLAGRACALLALRRAGHSVGAAIAVGAHGAPAWPTPWVGTITHTDAYASALVSTRDRYRGVGIDTESIMSVGVADEVAANLAPEWMTPDGYKTWAPDIRVERLTALFVAKECVYKCLRPLADDFIDFADATMSALDIDSATGAGTGTVRLLREFGPAIPAGLELTVRFAGAGALRHGLVLWPMVSAP